MKNEPTLQKSIGTFAAFSTVMGTVIGAGVFFKVSTVTASTHSATMTLWAWLIGGLLTICGGLTVAELAAAIPETGGAVKYLERIYGKLFGFLMGWAQMLVYFPANIAALSIIFSTQLINLVHLQPPLLLPIAILTGFSITGINLLGNRFGAQLQSVTLIVKLIPITAIIIWGLITPSEVNVSLLPINIDQLKPDTNIISSFSNGLLATLFAYDGWLGVGSIAGEIKNPKRDLPIVIGLGLAAITIVYYLINLVFLKTLPISDISGNLNAAGQAAKLLFGAIGGKVVTIGILISVYGAINGYTLTGIRVPFALASEGLLPFSQKLKTVSKKTSMPTFAALLQFTIAIIMMLLGSFDILTDMIVFVMWIFNTLLFVGVLRLRKLEPNLERPYVVPFFPILPTIATLGGLFIIYTTAINKPILASTGLLLTLTGVPFYIFYKSNKRRKLKQKC